MELSIFIAQIYAVVLFALSLGLLLNTAYYQKAFKAMLEEAGILYFGGAVALAVGFLIVTRHNVWQGWPILVTLVGWIALLKGVSLLVFPQMAIRHYQSWLSSKSFIHVWGAVALVLSLALGYFAFI